MSGDSSLIIIICILALLSASLLLINNRLAVKKPDPAKLSPYECGFSVSGYGALNYADKGKPSENPE
ncbi:17899_t:CDS:2 [Acaulospora morrowiae]|uniref:17899_t:CDS:1 n=1 Tax=Acaulospora morrowiae TaxID=94023 RepID=A0A9N9GRE4_9GLOM|nr:17899_t:CDS:2 [Acaulospora morrowiae]